jgi:hypothetical protein
MELNLSLTCEECKAEGKHILHVAYITEVECPGLPDPDGVWTWAVLNHDGNIKQEWPGKFVSNQAAKDHLNGLVGYME